MPNQQDVFTSMPIPKALAKMALPAILSQLITLVYNYADAYFIGRTGNAYMVAAASIVGVLFFITNALSNLFSVGAGSLVSRLLGRGEAEQCAPASAFGLYGAILLALCYSGACWLLEDTILRLLGASEYTYGFAASYLRIVVIFGALPATLSMTLSQLLRSEGRSSEASFGLALGGVSNIVLDPILMFVVFPAGQEVAAAGLATTLSNCISLVYFILTLHRRRSASVLGFAPRQAIRGARYAREILFVGFPSALSSLLSCLATIVLNHMVSRYGDIPLAAIGIVKKIDLLPANIGMGLCQGMMPLVAYHYAAKDHARMHEAISCARRWGVLSALCCVAVFEPFARPIVRLFLSNEEALLLGTRFLRICCLATPMMFCSFQMIFAFQAMGQGKQALLLSACRQGLFNVPLLFLLRYLFGLDGLVWTQVVSETLTVLAAAVIYTRFSRSLRAARMEKTDTKD